MTGIDRRTFIRRSLQGGAFALGGLPLVDLFALPALAADAPPVALRKGTDIPALVRETVAALGGMGTFVKAGETVVVKPNIGWDRAPEYAANTHPDVVKTVIELCLEAGAKKVRVFDRTCNDPRRCYHSSGLEKMFAAFGDKRAVLEHMDRRAYGDVAIRGGIVFDKWPFYRPALEADRFINLPIAKDHGISRLTLGMKNVMGVIGGNRGVLHQRIDEALADINLVVQSDLTIVDATRILVANGPQGGRLKDVEVRNTLIASPDIVAADAMAATLFGLEPQEISSIAAGARRGLGVMDLQKVRKV
ncbi:MAG: cytoplasmic protein [Desulfuromonas sp.]|nr:MAG: cytoplasmic protein [Desulfuromonas sp.]